MCAVNPWHYMVVKRKLAARGGRYRQVCVSESTGR